MDLSLTVEDPKMYTQPLTLKVTEVLLPDSDILENVCNESKRTRSIEKRQLRRLLLPEQSGAAIATTVDRAVGDPPRALSGGRSPVGDDRLAVNDDIPETDGVLVRIVEIGLIGYRVGIEDHDVGFHAGT